MKHIYHSEGTREHRLIYQTAETPEQITDTTVEATPKSSSDLSVSTENRVTQADENVAGEVKRLSDSPDFAALKQGMGTAAGAALGGAEHFFRDTSVAVHRAHTQLDRNPITQTATGWIRDGSAFLSQRARDLKTTVQGLTAGQEQTKDKQMKAENPGFTPSTVKSTEIPPQTATETAPAVEAMETGEAPKTHGEKLENQMRDALKELEEAKDGVAAFVAILKLIASIFAYIKSAMEGTLNDSLDKKGEKKPITPEQEEQRASRKSIVEEVMNKTSGQAPAELSRGLDQVRKERSAEQESNKQEMAESDNSIENYKKENEKMLGDKVALDKKINKLKGTDEGRVQIERLNVEVQLLTEKIEANNRAIEKLTTMRESLANKNEKLEKALKEMDAIKTDLENANSKLVLLQQSIDKLLSRNYEGGVPATSITLQDTPDGMRILVGGLDAPITQAISNDVQLVPNSNQVIIEPSKAPAIVIMLEQMREQQKKQT